MLLNYLKLSFRLLIRNSLLTRINVTGLAIGFTTFFILWQYTENELSFDRFHKDSEKIVRAGTVYHWTDDGKQWNQHTFGVNYPEINNRIAEELPEIIETTRIFNQGTFTPEYITDHGKEVFLTLINERAERKSFVETHIAYADSNLFKFFSLPLYKGNPSTVLLDANAVVLSRQSALKYFNGSDPVGQTLLLNDHIPLTVTGVFEDLPYNTHLNFEVVLSTARIRNNINKMIFSPGGPHCYYKLQEGTDVTALQEKINQHSQKYWLEVYGNFDTSHSETYLQPLSEMHLNSYLWDNYKGQSEFFIITLRTISIVILSMAWINYINMAIFSCRKRLRELATRKAIGAASMDLVRQFFTEALLTNIISLVLAFTIVQLVRVPCEYLFNFYIAQWNEITFSTAMVFLGFFGAGILVTGSYPVLKTLKSNPLDLFRNMKIKTFYSTGSEWLTIFQFVSGIVFIVWVFSAFHQINFILNKDIGLNDTRVMVIELPIARDHDFDVSLKSYLQEIRADRGVEEQTISLCITGDSEDNTHNVTVVNRIGTDTGGMMYTNGGVDENFIPFYGIKIIAGRNFLSDKPSDKNAIILSRGALTRLGFSSPENAVGQRVQVEGIDAAKGEEPEIIGVIEDYSQRVSLAVEGTGTGLFGIALTYNDYLVTRHIPKRISVRLAPETEQETIESLRHQYQSSFPGNTFTSYFLSNHVNRHYNDEKIARNQITLFTAIAVIIAGLGLLGMMSNTIIERTKEIGIRKVMGADVTHIIKVLLITTVRQWVVATIIGLPIAYYLITLYFQKFTEHVALQWWHFAFPIVVLLFIMLTTIVAAVYKAATANPVESLRYE